MELIVERTSRNNFVYFLLSGELSYEGVNILRNHIQQALDEGVIDVILNLEGLRMISSYGLSALLKLYKLLKQKNGNLHITSVKGHVAEVFSVTGISQVLPIYFTENDLWKALNISA